MLLLLLNILLFLLPMAFHRTVGASQGRRGFMIAGTAVYFVCLAVSGFTEWTILSLMGDGPLDVSASRAVCERVTVPSRHVVAAGTAAIFAILGVICRPEGIFFALASGLVLLFSASFSARREQTKLPTAPQICFVARRRPSSW